MFIRRKEQIIVASTSKDITASALAYTSSFAKTYKLLQVLLHFSAAVSPALSISKNSHLGATYDTVLAATTLSSATDYVFRPTGECIFVSNIIGNDEIDIDVAAVAATVYVTVEIEEL